MTRACSRVARSFTYYLIDAATPIIALREIENAPSPCTMGLQKNTSRAAINDSAMEMFVRVAFLAGFRDIAATVGGEMLKSQTLGQKLKFVRITSFGIFFCYIPI